MGLCIGSFLNVCISRIPARRSVVFPPSRCPACGAGIPFYYNIPILGWFILRGRSACCGAPLSFKYPLVEAVTAVFAVFLAVRFGFKAELFVYFAFVSSLIVVTFIDLKHQIIPDVISLPGIAVGLALSWVMPIGIVDALIGAVIGGGILFGIAAAYILLTGQDGMGGGDIKLLAMIGAFIGWKGVIVTLLLGSFLGATTGVIFIVFAGKGSKFPIPFGPFLAAGALSYMFFGEELINWYIIRAVGT